MKITCAEIEIAVANNFDTRKNIIVPNVSWGAGLHECDLLVINGNGYATEVEIKTSKSDLKKDFEKPHQHHSEKIKNLYYAVPENLLEAARELIPAHAGLIVCKRINTPWDSNISRVISEFVRKPKPTHKYRKMTELEILNVARLGCIRIWKLKQTIFTRNTSK